MNIQSPRLLADIAANSLRLPATGGPDPSALFPVRDAKAGTFGAELAAKARTPALPEAPEPNGRGAYKIAERTPAIMRQQPQPPSDSDWIVVAADDEATPAIAAPGASARHPDAADAPNTLHRTHMSDPPAPQWPSAALPVPLPAVVAAAPGKPAAHMISFGQMIAIFAEGPIWFTRGPLTWIAISAALIGLAIMIL